MAQKRPKAEAKDQVLQRRHSEQISMELKRMSPLYHSYKEIRRFPYVVSQSNFGDSPHLPQQSSQYNHTGRHEQLPNEYFNLGAYAEIRRTSNASGERRPY